MIDEAVVEPARPGVIALYEISCRQLSHELEVLFRDRFQIDPIAELLLFFNQARKPILEGCAKNVVHDVVRQFFVQALRLGAHVVPPVLSDATRSL